MEAGAGMEVRRARAPVEHAAAAALRAAVFFTYPLDLEEGLYIGPQAEASRAAWLDRQAAAELKKMQAVPGCCCLVALTEGSGTDGVPGQLGDMHNARAGCVVGTLHYTVDNPRATLRSQDALPLSIRSSDLAYLFNICVARDHRRSGIGGAMIREAHQQLERQGVKEAFVHVEDDNVAGQEFYRGLGYHETALEVDSWTYISGEGGGEVGRSLLSRRLDLGIF